MHNVRKAIRCNAFYTSDHQEFNQEDLFLPLCDKGAKEWAL